MIRFVFWVIVGWIVIKVAVTAGISAWKRAQIKRIAKGMYTGPTIDITIEEKTPTEIGENIRDAVIPVYERLKAVRHANAEANKAEAFGIALRKELAGESFKNTKAFGEALRQIDAALKDPETGLCNVPEGALRDRLLQVRRALDQRLSFEGLETLRRYLRDYLRDLRNRASGLPVEGAWVKVGDEEEYLRCRVIADWDDEEMYLRDLASVFPVEEFDSLSLQYEYEQARKLADTVEKIQREFSPGMGKLLEQYEADSRPLNVFKTDLGKDIIGKDELYSRVTGDTNSLGFSTDAAELGDKIFCSRRNVEDFISMLGGDKSKAESIARSYVSYVARHLLYELSDSPRLLMELIFRWDDWLEVFPNLRGELAGKVRQDIAEQAIRYPESWIKNYKESIRPMLVMTGAMSEKELTALDKQIDAIR